MVHTGIHERVNLHYKLHTLLDCYLGHQHMTYILARSSLDFWILNQIHYSALENSPATKANPVPM